MSAQDTEADAPVPENGIETLQIEEDGESFAVLVPEGDVNDDELAEQWIRVAPDDLSDLEEER